MINKIQFFLLLSFLGLVSCVQPQSPLPSAKSTSTEEVNESQVLPTQKSQEGTISTKIANDRVEQILQIKDIDELSGSTVSFPPGSLAIGAEVTFSAGISIANMGIASDLGIRPDDELIAASAAAVVESTDGSQPQNPFSISLPVINNAGLNLVATTYFSVIYKLKINATEYRVGIIPTDAIKVEKNGAFITFKTKYFGIFQVVSMLKSTSEVTEQVTKVPYKPLDKSKAIPAISWQQINATVSDDRQVQFFAKLSIQEPLASCYITIDDDRQSPFLFYYNTGTELTYTFESTNSEQHSIYARFQCLTSDGLTSGDSPWAFAVIPALLAPQVIPSPDTTPPASPIVVTTLALTRSSLVSFSWTTGGQGGNGWFRYKLNNDDLTSAAILTNATTLTTETLPDGTHTLYVQEKDEGGNWSNPGFATVVVDTIAPTMSTISVSNSTNTKRPQWTWSVANNSNGIFRYKLDNDELNDQLPETSALSYTPTSDLVDGNHTLYVQVRDEAGNWSHSNNASILIDSVAPSPPSISVIGITNNRRPTWTWSQGNSPGNGTFKYQLDDDTLASPTVSSSLTFTPTSDLNTGSHTLYVKEMDASGNWSNVGSATVNVDFTPPGVPTFSLLPPSPSNNLTPAWAWNSGIGGNGWFRYQLDNSDLSNATPTQQLSFSQTLTPGTHILYLEEKDDAGNWSSTISSAIEIDTSAPLMSSVNAKTSHLFGNIEISLDFSGAESYSAISVRRVPGSTAPSTCSSGSEVIDNGTNFTDRTYSISGMTPGSIYSFLFCFTDLAGNLGTTSVPNIYAGSHTAFVTSQTYNGNLKADYDNHSFVSGLAGADYRCQYSALLAGLDGPELFWRAIISDTTTGTKNRLEYESTILNTLGEKVETSSNLWTDGNLINLIKYDESHASSLNFGVWTGTASQGWGHSLTNQTCSDWTSDNAAIWGKRGLNSSAIADQWYSECWNNSTCTCDQSHHLYCVSQKLPGLNDFSVTPLNSSTTSISFSIPSAYAGVVQSIKIWQNGTSVAPNDDCNVGTLLNTWNASSIAALAGGAQVNYSSSGLSGSTYSYRICAFDGSNNILTTSHYNNVIMPAAPFSCNQTNSFFSQHALGCRLADGGYFTPVIFSNWSGPMNYAAALAFCAAKTDGGSMGWRLPTQIEGGNLYNRVTSGTSPWTGLSYSTSNFWTSSPFGGSQYYRSFDGATLNSTTTSSSLYVVCIHD